MELREEIMKFLGLTRWSSGCSNLLHFIETTNKSIEELHLVRTTSDKWLERRNRTSEQKLGVRIAGSNRNGIRVFVW